MGVIINEFGVDAEEPGEEGMDAQAPEEASGSTGEPSPEAIRAILRQKEERESRLFAH
jgi:hypothetical protein